MEVRVKERGRKRKKEKCRRNEDSRGRRRKAKLETAVRRIICIYPPLPPLLQLLFLRSIHSVFLLHIFPLSLFLLLLLFFLFISFFFSLPFRSFSFSPFLFVYPTFSSCPPFSDRKLNLSFESFQIIQSYKDSNCFEYYLKSEFFLILRNLESFECSKALNI